MNNIFATIEQLLATRTPIEVIKQLHHDVQQLGPIPSKVSEAIQTIVMHQHTILMKSHVDEDGNIYRSKEEFDMDHYS